MGWPRRRRTKRHATSTRSSKEPSAGKRTAGRAVVQIDLTDAVDDHQLAAIAIGAIGRDRTRRARSTDTRRSNPSGADSRISVPGESSGSPMMGAGPTGRFGSLADHPPLVISMC
jgi:hypothetical protein